MSFLPAPPSESPEAVALRLAEHIHGMANHQPIRKPDEAEKYWIDLFTRCLTAVKSGKAQG